MAGGQSVNLLQNLGKITTGYNIPQIAFTENTVVRLPVLSYPVHCAKATVHHIALCIAFYRTYSLCLFHTDARLQIWFHYKLNNNEKLKIILHMKSKGFRQV